MGRRVARPGASVPAHRYAPVEEFDISRLAKPLDAELQHNSRLIKEERLNMDRVNEDHARLLRENSVSVFFPFPQELGANWSRLKRMGIRAKCR